MDGIALVVLVPASGAATIAAVEVLSQGTEWPVEWPLVVPIVAPLTLIVVALWSYLPAMRATLAPSAIGGAARDVRCLIRRPRPQRTRVR